MMCFGIIYCVFILVGVYWGHGSVGFTFQHIWKLVSFGPSSNIFGVSFFFLGLQLLIRKPLDNVTKTYVVLFIYFKYFSLWTCLDHFYCSVFKFHWRLSSASSLQLSPYSETFISEIVIFSSRSFIRFFFLYFYFSFQYDHNSFSFLGIFVINI